MFSEDQYALLDFGEGRKLERFGEVILDRPAPAADAGRRLPQAWAGATARYDLAAGRGGSERGRWNYARWPRNWAIRHGELTFHLRPTPFGHVGVFPEQAQNWDWLAESIGRSPRPCRVLNLFAYTGGSTLAAAAAGAEVTHVDAAKGVVAWARENAATSELAAAPIRWIVEDVRRFVARELRRGNRYDGIVLDPPSYGHGPRGEAWQFAQHFEPLLADCGRLLAGDGAFLLASSHTPSLTLAQLRGIIAERARRPGAETLPMAITTASGRCLSSGMAARWRPAD